jgi:hypothetical protein
LPSEPDFVALRADRSGFLPDGGPFAIAGAIGTSNHDGTTLPVITQVGPGVNTKTALNP